MRAWSEQKTSVQRAHLENCWQIAETHAAESELLPLTLFALGRCAEAQEDLKDAYLFFRLASDWHTQRAKPPSRLWADIALALATVLECQDKLGEATLAYGDAHAHFLAAGDIQAAVSALKNQAELTAELGHWEPAEQRFRQLLGILQNGRAEASDLISDVCFELGRILTRLSRQSEALRMYEQAYPLEQPQVYRNGNRIIGELPTWTACVL